MLKNLRINNHILFLFVLTLISNEIKGQEIVKGKIVDKENNPVFAVNIMVKTGMLPLAVSNFDGKFEFLKQKIALNDTILFSCMGYSPLEICVKDVNLNKEVNVQLKESEITLDEVTIVGKPSISKEFSVKELDKLSIYMAPASSGDPLKAITSLPYSTNTTESANPEIRGSSSDYSRVIVNNVPMYKPVRNSQLNGVGHFSLLNTEIIGNQLVYAGNPPLKYGNSTSGLVEIETQHRLENDSKYKVSLSLANVGLLFSQPFKEPSSFIQIYGNFQFSEGYVNLNKKNLDYIKNFKTYDIGINYRQKISDNWSLNVYSYAVAENYNADNSMYNFRDNMYSEAKRNFNIININYRHKNTYISINNGTNFSYTNFKFGNYDIDQNERQLYTSLNYKTYFGSSISFQGGVSHDYSRLSFDNIFPYYYSIRPSDPFYSFKNATKNNNLEAYLYGKINLKRWIFGVGFRKNIPFSNQNNYLSYQANFRYNINNIHSLILSGGKYNGYNIPNYVIEEFSNVKSNQIGFDYLFNYSQLQITTSLYYRKDVQPLFYQETGSTLPTRIRTYGAEFSVDYSFNKFNITASYVYLFSEMNNGKKWFNAHNRMKYLVRGSINYYNNKLFNTSINFIARPGLYYTPITTSSYDEVVSNYRPIYGELYSEQYNKYSSIDLSINKIIKWKKLNITLFGTLTNLLNTSNQERAMYNDDYTKSSFWLYQKRLVYFGTTISF